MIGHILVINNITKEKTYVSYNTITKEKYQELKDNELNNTLYCDCLEKNKIQIKIAKRGKTYYFYPAHHGFTEKHNIQCPKHCKYIGKSKYDSGWKETIKNNGEIIYIARLDNKLFNINNDKLLLTETDSSNTEYIKSYINSSTKKGFVTLLGLATKLNLITWKKIIDRNMLPKNINEFLKAVYETMKHIEISNKRKTLFKINFNKNTLKELCPNKDFVYVNMLLCNTELVANKYTLTLKDSFEVTHNFYCSKKIFDDKFTRLAPKYKLKQGDKIKIPYENIITCGFSIKKNIDDVILTFTVLDFFVINNFGLYSESSYEFEVYNKLCTEHRKFYKPYTSFPEYGDKIPDFILTDTSPITIGEIFGMNTETYLDTRNEKINLAKNLEGIYNFWKWDAYLKESIPKFPPIK